MVGDASDQKYGRGEDRKKTDGGQNKNQKMRKWRQPQTKEEPPSVAARRLWREAFSTHKRGTRLPMHQDKAKARQSHR